MPAPPRVRRIRPAPPPEPWADLGALDPTDPTDWHGQPLERMAQHRRRGLVLALQPDLWRLDWLSRACGRTLAHRPLGPVSGAIACGWSRSLLRAWDEPATAGAALVQARAYGLAAAFDRTDQAVTDPHTLRELLQQLAMGTAGWRAAAAETVQGWPPPLREHVQRELVELGLTGS